MIPELIIDKKYIQENWNTPEAAEETIKLLENCVQLKGSNFPVYLFQEMWITMNVFKQFKNLDKEFFEYGYGDTEESISKYLQKYADDKENNYFVYVSLMSMDYEKYYKNGSYINKDGVDTNEDYYEYIDQHPEMEVPQDFENQWIHFCISKLKD
jgi:hypothetical protein